MILFTTREIGPEYAMMQSKQFQAPDLPAVEVIPSKFSRCCKYEKKKICLRNGADPNRTAPKGAVRSGSALVCYFI